MSARYYRITNIGEWASVMLEFKAACEEYGVITVDSEDIIGVDDHWAAFESIIIGTGDGFVYDFHVPSLKAEAKQRGKYKSKDLSTVLPPSIVKALHQENLFKLGSDLGLDSLKDFSAFGVEVKPCFCTQPLHRAAEAFGFFDAQKNQTEAYGLGRSSFEVFSADYKPLKAAKYWKTYTQEQPRAWRWFCNPLWLYRWEQPLKPFQILYKLLDAQVPLCLLAHIIKLGIDQGCLSTCEGKSLSQVFQDVLRPFQAVGAWEANRSRKRRKGTGGKHAVCEHVASCVLFQGILSARVKVSTCHADTSCSDGEV